MKNTNITSFKQRLSFNIFRWLAICALICTIGMSIFLWVESLMPAEQSAEQSGALTDSIKDKVEVLDNDAYIPLQSFRFSAHAKLFMCVGDTEKLTFSFYPSNATNKKLTYSSANEDVCTVDEKGNVTYTGYGSTSITCTSVDNPNLSVVVASSCAGYSADESVTDLRLAISASPTSATRTTIYLGNYTKPIFQDQEGRVISLGDIDMTSSDQTTFTIRNHYIYGTKVGNVTMSVVCQKANLTKDLSIEVLPSDKIMPTGYVFKQDTVYVTRTTNYTVSKNIDHALPEGAISARFWIEVEDTSIVSLEGDSVYAKKLGQTTITISPYTDPTQKFSFTIVVYEPAPDHVVISGKSRIVAGNTYKYVASFSKDGLMANMTGTIWEVDGGKATISENGKLVVNSIGWVTVRARSATDPSVYAEMRVRVSLFASFATFVRKIIGHFSCFAILGIGFTVVYFLLLRPRYLYAPCALVSGFFVAVMSEIFQMPIFTTGRGPSWVDVMTDTCGVATGVAIASAIIAVYLIWIRIVSKKQSLKVRRTLALLSGKTMLLSPTKTRLLTDMQEYCLQNTQNDDSDLSKDEGSQCPDTALTEDNVNTTE